ncbi:reticulon-like protein B14 [Prosopis cineraria]|uniref:reticulon-like protein B14 n=1 Tax=Prosopis cineraria TaxID=364024 RepID=UPI00240ED123|nr:reticulon-like protein B14 [Prosopis cineraria]
MASGSYEASRQARLFGRQRPFHAILGGGKVADILMWRNKKLSASILVGLSTIWFLLEVVEFHFITLLCYFLIFNLLFFFLWYNTARFITWSPPCIYEVGISESTWRYLFKRFNWFMKTLCEISTGKDLKLLFMTITGLWILSAIGTCFTALNLLYIISLCMMTLPVMYEQYECEVTYLASKGNRDLNRLFRKLDSKFLSKIPRLSLQ